MNECMGKERAFIERWDSKSKPMAERAYDLCTDRVTKQEIEAFIWAVEHDLADDRVLGLMGFNALMQVEGVLNDPGFYRDVYKDTDTEEVRALKALGQEARELWGILKEKYGCERKWALKIRAFLCQLPWGALCKEMPSDEESEKVIKGIVGDFDRKLTQKAADTAFGLDVPAFVRAKDKEWQVFAEKPILTHPLSGRYFDVPASNFIQCNKARNVVTKVINGLKQDDLKKMFLTLWRLLPVHVIGEGLGPLGEHIPADPRVPDHSIWDHAATASAFAATYDENEKTLKPALLIFTLASAQDFLAAARRTQDLWMGSFLFSWLIWQAMKPIVDMLGPDSIIYPSLHGQPLVDRWLYHEIGLEDKEIKENAQDVNRLKIGNLPNLFTALVPANQVENLAEKAGEHLQKAREVIFKAVKKYVEEALQEEVGDGSSLEEIAQALIRDTKRQTFVKSVRNLVNGSDEYWDSLWARQREAFLEPNIFWVAHPWMAHNGSTRLADLEAYHKNLMGKREELGLVYECVRNADPNAEDNLGLAYPIVSELTGRMLVTRKNLRHFLQNPEPGHKCSQCGIREALHPTFIEEEDDTYPELRAFWELLMHVGAKGGKKLAGRIRRGDRLCAVCLTKRLAWEAFFLERAPNEGGFSDVKQELEKEGELPAHLLFPSTPTIATAKFKEHVLEALGKGGPNQENRKKLWGKLKTYAEKTKEAVDGQFFPAPPIPRLEKMARKVAQELGLGDPDAQRILNDFLRLDGDWLYLESFEPDRFEHEFGLKLAENRKSNLKEARRELEELLSIAEGLGIPKPQHYYALLAMDGDHIGEWVTGRRGPELQEVLHPNVVQIPENSSFARVLKVVRPLGPAHHRALSAALKNFALEVVRPIVEEKHTGKLIYAGGDDVLALLPLEDLLSVMHNLYSLFTCCSSGSIDLGDGSTVSFDGLAVMRSGSEERWLLLPGSKMSTSAGVAIAHHTHPLWHVVEEARLALKEAKDGYDRDAWAVHILKRSGEPVHTGGKWLYVGQFVLHDLQEVVNLFIKGLSPRFLYEMQRISEGMTGLTEAAMEAELGRLLRRREGLSKEDHERLLGLKIERWPAQIKDKERDPWGTVLGWLKLAQFLARGARG